MSPRKEPNYLSSIHPSFLSPPPIRDEKKYHALFKDVTNEKRIGEASPIYLRDPESPNLIKNLVLNPKIVIILRDPVERAYSQYLLRMSNGMKYSFSEAINLALDSGYNDFNGRIVNGGMYYKQVKRYIDTFGEENVIVVVFEEFIKDPQKIVQQVIDFLGVDAKAPETIDLPHNLLTRPRNKLASSLLQNQTLRQIGRHTVGQSVGDIIVKKILGKKVSKPKMEQKDRAYLEKLYEENVINLEKLLGRTFPWSVGTIKLNGI